MPHKDPKKRKEYHHNYWEKNKDKLSKENNAYREANKEKIKSFNHNYWLKNKAKLSFMKMIYYLLNSDYYTIYRKIDYEINGDKRLAANSIYRKRPEIKKRDNIKRQKKQQEKLDELMLRITGGHPPCCMAPGCDEDDKDKLVIDHIKNGGRQDRGRLNKLQWLRNWLKRSDEEIRESLQILSASCNHKKEMMRRRGESYA